MIKSKLFNGSYLVKAHTEHTYTKVRPCVRKPPRAKSKLSLKDILVGDVSSAARIPQQGFAPDKALPDAVVPLETKRTIIGQDPMNKPTHHHSCS